MRIHWKDQFKDDYQKLEKSLKQPIQFRRALYKAIQLLQAGKDLTKSYPVNRLTKRGEGWFDCYITEDIVMIYNIQGQTVKLIAIGPAKEMYNR